jgi:hypothetical protein
MLAEIFMVRAETVARASQETTPVSISPFIPFDRSVQLKFKDGNMTSLRCEIAETSANQSLTSRRTWMRDRPDKDIQTMISAYEHGQNAARHGKHIQACPFDPGTAEWREWRDGFMAYRP